MRSQGISKQFSFSPQAKGERGALCSVQLSREREYAVSAEMGRGRSGAVGSQDPMQPMEEGQRLGFQISASKMDGGD